MLSDGPAGSKITEVTSSSNGADTALLTGKQVWVVVPRFSYPPQVGGDIRLWHILQLVKQFCSVSLVTYHGSYSEETPEGDSLFEDVVLIDPPAFPYRIDAATSRLTSVYSFTFNIIRNTVATGIFTQNYSVIKIEKMFKKTAFI